ncbi:MAG: hypothetical protein IT361_16305 [Gemmatimonadaceae bacterium]|nr:hypothetical protein [Gemmatimonadaceae bacterium]
MGRALCRALAAGRRWSRAGALILGLLADVGGAQSTGVRIDRGRFTIVAEPEDSLLASALAARAVATDTFPGLPRPSATVLIQIAADQRSFRALVGDHAPEWGAAFAFPAERRVVMQGRSAPSSAGDPRQVLRHELAHLALHEALGDLPPRWFDEGYASWAAGEWGREEVIAANLGLALGRYRTLAGLDSGFAAGSGEADAAYALSYRAVAELVALDEARGLTLLFRYWREEGSLDRALRRGYGLTLGGFERRWIEQTRRRYGGLALFADVTVGTLALLVIVAPLYVIRRRRDRVRLAQMRASDAATEQRDRESALEALLRSVDDPTQAPPREPGSSS